MKKILIDGIEQSGILYTSGQIEKLFNYLDELSVWNRKAGFVKAEGDNLVIRHILDSLSGVPLLKKIDFNTAADAGTGAGLPGIPLSIFFPDKKFTLIERSRKKCLFLSGCKTLFSLDNIDIYQGSLEDLDKKFDVVTFRAFRNFTQYYSVLNKTVEKGGILFAYKGRISEIESELGQAGISDYTAQKVVVPFLDEERHLVIIKKTDLP